MGTNKNAKKIDEVTNEMWEEVSEFNRDMVEDYLDNQTHLSDKTLKQYTSGLRLYFYWVKENLDNKNCTEIKKKEYLKYQNSLARRGLSESAIRFKKSSVSAFNKYIMFMYEDEYPMFRNYVTSEMKVIQTGFVRDKKPLTKSEFDNLIHKLEEMERWEQIAYLQFSYSTGCRRAESRQLLKEVVNYGSTVTKKIEKDQNGNDVEIEKITYRTHEIRCKGSSKVGKVRKLQFGQEAMDSIKKWIEVRGEDDCPYVFTVNYEGKVKQVGEGTFNDWCNGIFTKIVGRRVHPHLLRESRATNLVIEEGKSIETAQTLLGHNSSETTKIYIISDKVDDASDAF